MSLGSDKKHVRIRTVLDAAERLIRRSGAVEFSMRELAKEAGVSPATPFNLLGSKGEILSALVERSFASPEVDLQGDPIDLIFQACAWVADRYAADDDYFRALLLAAGTASGPEEKGIQQWELALRYAQEAGRLLPLRETRLLAEALEMQFIGILALWARRDLPSSRLSAQYRHAVALLLLGVATEAGRARVEAHRLEAAAALA